MRKKYKAQIIGFDTDDVVIISIEGVILYCFCFDVGDDVHIGETWFVDLEILDMDLDSIEESNPENKCAIRVNDSLTYLLQGIYYADIQSIDIGFLLDLSCDALYDYGYLDRKNISVTVTRFDVEFIEPVVSEK